MNSTKPGLEFLGGHQEFGQIISWDEAYDVLVAFGYVSEEAAGARKAGPRVNPHQSTLNKLAQYGQAARATNTAGSYGDGRPPTVNVAANGNMHPEVYVRMEKEETGSHVAQSKERFLIGTGEPVQPHDDIPDDYKLPEGHERWKYVPLIPEVAGALGILEASNSPNAGSAGLGGAK